ncbi:GSCOCG00004037001-RA-CDS [Cotesia congregata]|uniref:Similar to Litaf: Lipopolysaccharide-induced tumor necrosis factor-alpha factor homolog (Rattus norvegicus) n=1 Tax=Cotesia congregata TaxID=51543 RepID=A0A8J2H7J2_COTCN|nr:GSCOCG00004037001-RA-CDS [Cotesia congregata]CAG5082064.1 Similar to Litaf: Lipopolysaccharide-induced tumor necrosis factor-alpha factor homolog (Rattus norvegicus) [Cotesia congregata]
MNNQGIPQPGFYPPAPGFNNQPMYSNIQPQSYPMYPYPGQAPSAPEVSPPPAYNPDYPPVTHAPGPVVTQIVPVNFGPDSVRLICPHCNADISTRVEVAASTKTHIFAMILCLLGLCLCVPCAYCGDCFAAANHYCPCCNARLGSHEP